MAGPRANEPEDSGAAGALEEVVVVEPDDALSNTAATDGALPVMPASALWISFLNPGRAVPTASKISRPEPGTTCATATAMFRYSLGTARQTASTILPALDGAAMAAARAIATASLGCSAAAVPAAVAAMSGSVLA